MRDTMVDPIKVIEALTLEIARLTQRAVVAETALMQMQRDSGPSEEEPDS